MIFIEILLLLIFSMILLTPMVILFLFFMNRRIRKYGSADKEFQKDLSDVFGLNNVMYSKASDIEPSMSLRRIRNQMLITVSTITILLMHLSNFIPQDMHYMFYHYCACL